MRSSKTCLLVALLLASIPSGLVASSAWAAASPAYVQSTNTGGGGSSTISATFVSNVAQGDLIVVGVAWNSTTVTVSSVADSLSNTYSSAVGPTTNATLGGSCQIFYAANTPAGANSVTVTFSGTISGGDLAIHEYSGIRLTSPLDVTAAATGNNTSPNSGSATTTQASELIFGWVFAANGPTVTAGSGFTKREDNQGRTSEDETVSSAGSNSATFTLSSRQQWICQMATFKGSSLHPLPILGVGD